MELDKKQYLEIRKELRRGIISNKGWELLYDYYNENRDNKKEYSYDEFVNSLNLYLQRAPLGVEKVIKHYDNRFVITKIIKINDNNVLLEY